jgi:hypothetical protein
MAPFNRYQTLDVVRAMAESGRDDVALYTGNDDNIVMDLLTPHRFTIGDETIERRIVGGLLGHWSVWTKAAVGLLVECHHYGHQRQVPRDMFVRSIEVTDSEVLRRQGLLEGIWCLNPDEGLSPGQKEEIDRVYAAYPHLNDDAFVEEGRDEWLSG